MSRKSRLEMQDQIKKGLHREETTEDKHLAICVDTEVLSDRARFADYTGRNMAGQIHHAKRAKILQGCRAEPWEVIVGHGPFPFLSLDGERRVRGSKQNIPTLKFPPACLTPKACSPLYLESLPIPVGKFRCYVLQLSYNYAVILFDAGHIGGWNYCLRHVLSRNSKLSHFQDVLHVPPGAVEFCCRHALCSSSHPYRGGKLIILSKAWPLRPFAFNKRPLFNLCCLIFLSYIAQQCFKILI